MCHAWAGTSFAILMSRFSSNEDVEEVARRILTLVSDPVTIGGQCRVERM